MPDSAETAKSKDFHTGRWEWLTKSRLETTAAKLPLVGAKLQEKIGKVVTEHEDPLYGMSEGAKNAQESQGNWQAQAVIDREQSRITDRLKSSDTKIRSDATNEALELRSAVREGGTTLSHYIESKGDQIESAFEDARRKAELKPKESEGQTAAYELIVDEADVIKHELSGENVPDKAGKLQKLAGMANMLEGISGENFKGLKRLKIWLQEQALEISQAIQKKQQELGLDKDLQDISRQINEQSSEASSDMPIQIENSQNQETLDADQARQVQKAVESGDDSLLPEASQKNSVIEKTRTLIKFNKDQELKKKKVDQAQVWVGSRSQ
jgi:hypothetical protein